ncbi:MAG: hypothetical protein J6Y85_00630 [Alphaproteobacteria bacterium]|nr:hypothetical protein [Alphaproteobacteria bacterium]
MKITKSLKNTVGVLAVAVVLMTSRPSYAPFIPALCWPIGVCLWTDVVGLVARVANIAAGYKLNKTEIDATAGFEKIKNNIGMGEGPGISATGASGADLVTEEEGAQMQAEQAERAAMVPDIIVNLFTDAEENEQGEGFRAIREANAQILLSDYCSECTQRSTTTGECLKYTQRLCTEAEQVAINQGCDACLERNDQGQCIAFDSASCARERQNYWLIQAVNGAEGTLDAHVAGARKFYENLKKLLVATSTSTTVSDFWSDLQRFSVQANTIVPEITFVYAMDLLSTSERRVSEVGVELEVFPKQDEKEDDS